MKNNLIKNGFYNTLGGAIRIILALLTIPILIRLIGVEEYGLWILAHTIVQVVNSAEAGLSIATTVFLSKDLAREDIEEISQTLTITIGSMLILSTVVVIVLWVSAESIVHLFPKLGELQQITVTRAIQIGSFVIWAKLLQQVLIGIEQAYQRYNLISILNTIQWILISLGLFGVAWFDGRTVELMQWYALASTAVLFSHIWVVRSLLQGVNIRPVFKIERAVMIGRYALKTWLTGLGGIIFSRGDRLVIGSMLGSETLGIYAAIADAAGAINTFSALPVQPLVPALSSYMAGGAEQSHTQLKHQVKQAFEINALVALVSSTVLFILAPFIMQIMVGSIVNNEYILAFRIATVIYALYSLNAVGFYILLCVAVNLCMTIQILGAIFSLLLISLGAYYFGLTGAVLGNIGFLTTWFFIWLAMKQIQFPLKLVAEWLSFPIIWFIISISFIFLMPSLRDIKINTSTNINTNVSLNIIITILSVIVLMTWFMKNQNLTLSLIIRKIHRVFN